MMITIPKPFLGRLLITPIKENLKDIKEKQADDLLEKTLGVKPGERKIQLISGEKGYNEETGKWDKFEVKNEMFLPYQKARVLSMAEDAFGEAFRRKYGQEIKDIPKVGDVVYYIPGQAYKIDAAGKYFYINDEDIMGFGEIQLEIKEDIKEV